MLVLFFSQFWKILQVFNLFKLQFMQFLSTGLNNTWGKFEIFSYSLYRLKLFMDLLLIALSGIAAS